MSARFVDVLILGAGFGGSLLAAVLGKNGRQVALVDRATHPRFAIGESSTPLADATLAHIAMKYGLPELIPLTQYGSWKRRYPQIGCGVKTGFSYFGHRMGLSFRSEDQLLVAGSGNEEQSDTHWLRSDVDEFMFYVAENCGVRALEAASYVLSHSADGWLIEGESGAEGFSISSSFVVDATGGAGEVLKCIGIPVGSESLQTNSSALFAHFANVSTVAGMLSEIKVDVSRHPFCCDSAAVHHILDDGWMWQLRFDDSTVSAGILTDERGGSASGSSGRSSGEVWNEQLRRYPFLTRQFQNSTVVRPVTGIRQSGRLQRICEKAAGPDWAALPGAAGFIDPLHSSGIAHTLFGVRRLAAILTESPTVARALRMSRYSYMLIDELRLVDALVEGCYAALPSFRLWCDWCMLYFAAVTSSEQTGEDGDDASFLLASDACFRDVLREARQRLQRVIDQGRTDPGIEEFEMWLRIVLHPWNRVGLLDPSVNGMYRRTAAPKSSNY